MSDQGNATESVSGCDPAARSAVRSTVRPTAHQSSTSMASLVRVLIGGSSKDRISPASVSVGRFVAESLPECEALYFEDEGHLTPPRNHVNGILSSLVSRPGE